MGDAAAVVVGDAALVTGFRAIVTVGVAEGSLFVLDKTAKEFLSPREAVASS